MTNAAAKTEAIAAYFDRWERDIDKAERLIAGDEFHLEGCLVLSCHIGAVAAMRYPAKRDGEAYVEAVLAYSGEPEFWNQIDLLFLYQWPRSKLRNHGHYIALGRYDEVLRIVKARHGEEQELKFAQRFVNAEELTNCVLASHIENLEEAAFRAWLRLFSLSEELYRYVRCDAVHNCHRRSETVGIRSV